MHIVTAKWYVAGLDARTLRDRFLHTDERHFSHVGAFDKLITRMLAEQLGCYRFKDRMWLFWRIVNKSSSTAGAGQVETNLQEQLSDDHLHFRQEIAM